MIEDCVIVGGGVAGLSAANQLADAGRSPVLIEANDYPAHRICGEFLSSECLPILHRWEIPLPITTQKCHLYSGDRQACFQFPTAAASCSRYSFDALLQQRAQSKGVKILTRTTVSALNLPDKHSNFYELTLSDGQSIKAHHLILGTGRIPRINVVEKPMPLKYVGFKAHFKGIKNNQAVDIHCFNGGYLGISSIDANTTNIACLVRKECIPDSDQIEDFLPRFFEKKATNALRERLANARMLFPKWMVGQIPEFGIRSHPAWERVFWIGDAAGSIPPISGDGLAMGITSGCMAADYLLRSDARKFKEAWLKRYRKRFFWAHCVHSLMLSPWMSQAAIGACNTFPLLPSTLWKLTREI